MDISSLLYMCVVTNMWCKGHVKSPIRNIFAEKTLKFSVLICPSVFSCHFSLLLQQQQKRRLSLRDLLDKPQAIQSSWLKKRSSASSVLAFLELSIGHMCFAYAARLEDTGTQTKGQKNNMARLCSSFRSSERDHFNESDNEVWEKDAARNRKKQYWRGSSDSNKALNAVDCGVPAGSVFVRRWHCTHPPATYRDIIIMLALLRWAMRSGLILKSSTCLVHAEGGQCCTGVDALMEIQPDSFCMKQSNTGLTAPIWWIWTSLVNTQQQGRYRPSFCCPSVSSLSCHRRHLRGMKRTKWATVQNTAECRAGKFHKCGFKSRLMCSHSVCRPKESNGFNVLASIRPLKKE